MSTKHKTIRKRSKKILEELKQYNLFQSFKIKTQQENNNSEKIKISFQDIKNLEIKKKESKKMFNKTIGLIHNIVNQKKETLFESYIKKLKKKKSKKAIFF